MNYHQYCYVVVVVVRERDTPSHVHVDFFPHTLLGLKGGRPKTDTVAVSQLKHTIRRCLFYREKKNPKALLLLGFPS